MQLDSSEGVPMTVAGLPAIVVFRHQSTHLFTTRVTYRIDYPDATQHIVHCRHSALGGRRKAFVNGILQFTDRLWIDVGSEHPFAFEGHDYVFAIAYSEDLFGYRLSLRVDGQAVVAAIGAAAAEPAAARLLQSTPSMATLI
jgi:hypothetical protein